MRIGRGWRRFAGRRVRLGGVGVLRELLSHVESVLGWPGMSDEPTN